MKFLKYSSQKSINITCIIYLRIGCPGGHCQEQISRFGDICATLGCPGGHCQEQISRFGDICGNINCIHIWLKRGPT